MVVRRRGIEVRGQPGGNYPVAEAVVPRGGGELGPHDRGEALVPKGQRIDHLPSVLLLEVVGEAEEVVAGVAVGGDDLLRFPQAVGPVRVAVEVAAEEAALSSVLEQVPCQGGILRHPSSAIHVEGFSAIPRSVRASWSMISHQTASVALIPDLLVSTPPLHVMVRMDMRPGQYRRDASNPNISSLLVTPPGGGQYPGAETCPMPQGATERSPPP